VGRHSDGRRRPSRLSLSLPDRHARAASTPARRSAGRRRQRTPASWAKLSIDGLYRAADTFGPTVTRLYSPPQQEEGTLPPQRVPPCALGPGLSSRPFTITGDAP